MIMLAVCLAASGCGVIENAAHTLVVQPLNYCAHKDKYASHHRHREMADEAWESIETGATACTYSFDYELGFKDGYADFLDAGPGNTPALPPRRYWKGKYQNPAGHQSILDWYAGFRHGTNVAAESGWRQFVTLPSSFSAGPGPLDGLHSPVVVPAPEVIPSPPSSPGLDPPGLDPPVLDPPPPALEPASSELRMLEEVKTDAQFAPSQSGNQSNVWPQKGPDEVPMPSARPGG